MKWLPLTFMLVAGCAFQQPIPAAHQGAEDRVRPDLEEWQRDDLPFWDD